ncbi:hypothetical protein EDS67_29190 [candidate division KSB1 bacterium]|nr:MAG: hypothetical protein EDS67_29190 [candidate division KSB1 bacterium]MBC6950518.1 hypothetical protein [candidate division KSB1 bacterium]MCE7945345.1 hypothetical protein [Chlorobi bacterium CHB1]
MYKSDTNTSHVNDVTLWAWRCSELEAEAALAVRVHVEACPACAHRAAQLAKLLETMHARHHAVQPTLAQQMHLLRALEAQAAPPAESVWVKTSGRMVRWLAPAVVALAVLFVAIPQDGSSTASDRISAFLADTPEAALFSARTEEEVQSAMLELVLNSEQTQ